MPVDQTGESSSSTKRVAKGCIASEGHAAEQQLPCPRCDSLNTKFCYYNNYNSSQPRHFCKSCRRYWTHGGALRDIPIGGGSRKSSAKRSRSSSSSSSNTPATLMGPPSANTLLLPISTTPLPSYPLAAPTGACANAGSFSSFLNTHQGTRDVLGLGGFGIGLELEDVGAACYGFGRGITWPFPDIEKDSPDGASSSSTSGTFINAMVSGGGGDSIPAASHSHPWQFESAGSSLFSLGAGDYSFSWPELAISTSVNGLK